MELDPKIKVKKIFDVFSDIEEVKKYYGKEVYCADFLLSLPKTWLLRLALLHGAMPCHGLPLVTEHLPPKVRSLATSLIFLPGLSPVRSQACDSERLLLSCLPIEKP